MNPADIQITLAYSSWIKNKPVITARHIPTGLEYTATGRSAHNARALAIEGLEQLLGQETAKNKMNPAMNIEEFFNLPQAEQEEIARLVLKRRKIRDEAQDIKTHRDRLNELETELQQKCTHPAVKKTHKRNEHYDSHTNFSTDFYCPDCDKRWTEQGSK